MVAKFFGLIDTIKMSVMDSRRDNESMTNENELF